MAHHLAAGLLYILLRMGNIETVLASSDDVVRRCSYSSWMIRPNVWDLGLYIAGTEAIAFPCRRDEQW